MGMSPSRMPQAQGMMAGHGGGNMVGQTANQGQFLSQTQFPPGPAVAATGAMNVTVGPGMGQAPAQAPVTQVRPADEPEFAESRATCCLGPLQVEQLTSVEQDADQTLNNILT